MADHLGRVIVITNEEEWEKKLQEAEKKPVIVDFFATWCPPCVMISPEFAKLSNEYPNMIFIKVNVDDVPSVAENCNITAMPTFQVYREGKKVDELVGASKDNLKKLLEAAAAAS